jgi:hypothetical protein
MADLPAWQPVEQADAQALSSSHSGRIVAVVAAQSAVSEGWAAAAAVGLARSWSRSGLRLILVDAGLEQPSLHDAVGLPNREGLSDAALYGASVARVSQPVGGDFFLIGAGAPVADATSVLESARWGRLADGMVEAGVTMLLYVRDGEAQANAFVESASDVVVLAPEAGELPGAVETRRELVRAVIGAGDGAGGTLGDTG